MAAFTSHRRKTRSPFVASIRKHPFLMFGLPFMTTMVVASFGLQRLTQTRYDLHQDKKRQVSKEEELHMSKNRRKVDIREEYFRLQSGDSKIDLDDWEPVRIQRPEGVPEWGVPPSAPDKPPESTDASPRK